MNTAIYKIDGWMHDQEINWLYNVARLVPEGGIIVELGVWQGKSSGALYEGAGPNKLVVSVDWWGGQPDLVDTDHRLVKEQSLLDAYLRNMAMLGQPVQPYSPGDTVGPRYHTGDSVEAAALFEDGTVHLCFVDADHRFVGNDIKAWLPKMHPEGIICGHDYFAFFESIQPQIHEQFSIDEIIYSIWVRYVNFHVRPGWY